MSATEKPLILVLDDDLDCLELTRHILEGEGFRVASCFTEDEALLAMASERPALIITDLMMGTLDAGFAFAQRVKEDARFAGVPLVVLTAVGKQLGYDFAPRSAGDLAAMHVDGFVDKPATPAKLLAKVRELLGG